MADAGADVTITVISSKLFAQGTLVTVHLKVFSPIDKPLIAVVGEFADVIVPAGEIFIRIMKWVDADEIFIPKIGLGDGIVREAYIKYLNGKKVRNLKSKTGTK